MHFFVHEGVSNPTVLKRRVISAGPLFVAILKVFTNDTKPYHAID